MKTRIGIIFGGRSGEHEVSIRSAKTVIQQIDKDKYDIFPIAIGKNGNWLSASESAELLPLEAQETLRGGGEKLKNEGGLLMPGDVQRRRYRDRQELHYEPGGHPCDEFASALPLDAKGDCEHGWCDEPGKD